MQPKDLIVIFDEINKLLYERSKYLNCLKDKNIVPVHMRRKSSASSIVRGPEVDSKSNHSAMHSEPREENLAKNSGSNLEVSKIKVTNATKDENLTAIGRQQLQQEANSAQIIHSAHVLSEKTQSNKIGEDQSITIIKNILNQNNILAAHARAKLQNEEKPVEAESSAKEATPSEHAVKSKTKQSKKKSSNSKEANAARRAKTRDEMFAFYCVFGEFSQSGSHFLAIISNILRDSLEGILTNSEMFYKDLQLQNRQITHKSSLKESYSEFAEAMIKKLKSYYFQCERYLNQCLKEFRDCLISHEIISANIPRLIIREIFNENKAGLMQDLAEIKRRHHQVHQVLETERVTKFNCFVLFALRSNTE